MKIHYTYTDEAPALATHSLLPGARGVRRRRPASRSSCATSRSRAGSSPRSGRRPDALGELGELARTPDANIVKLPNISASIPQLKAAIKELQDAGHDVPEYEDAREVYDTVKGSAVNPVLREGNSDRRAPASVKAFARKHRTRWARGRRTRRRTWRRWARTTSAPPSGRVTSRRPASCGSSTSRADGSVTVLKDGLTVQDGEIVDAAVMRRRALDAFLAREVADAKARASSSPST